MFVVSSTYTKSFIILFHNYKFYYSTVTADHQRLMALKSSKPLSGHLIHIN